MGDDLNKYRLCVVARAVLVLALSVAVCGCALGNHGVLLARYTHTATALVIDLHSAGLHVRPDGDEAGVTIGYRRASYVFARATGDDPPESSIWRWFSAPWPEGPPLVRASRVLGIELGASPGVHRVTVGYLDYVVSVGPDADASRVVEIHYDRTNAARTYVSIEEIRDDTPLPLR